MKRKKATLFGIRFPPLGQDYLPVHWMAGGIIALNAAAYLRDQYEVDSAPPIEEAFALYEAQKILTDCAHEAFVRLDKVIEFNVLNLYEKVETQ